VEARTFYDGEELGLIDRANRRWSQRLQPCRWRITKMRWIRRFLRSKEF